jgi:hypothetical protein
VAGVAGALSGALDHRGPDDRGAQSDHGSPSAPPGWPSATEDAVASRSSAPMGGPSAVLCDRGLRAGRRRAGRSRSLSGGLAPPSSAPCSPRRGPRFLVGYVGRPPRDERADARRIAEILGLRFHELELSVAHVVASFPDRRRPPVTIRSPTQPPRVRRRRGRPPGGRARAGPGPGRRRALLGLGMGPEGRSAGPPRVAATGGTPRVLRDQHRLRRGPYQQPMAIRRGLRRPNSTPIGRPGRSHADRGSRPPRPSPGSSYRRTCWGTAWHKVIGWPWRRRATAAADGRSVRQRRVRPPAGGPRRGRPTQGPSAAGRPGLAAGRGRRSTERPFETPVLQWSEALLRRIRATADAVLRVLI